MYVHTNVIRNCTKYLLQMRRTLKVHVRPPYYADLHEHQSDVEGSWWTLAQRNGITDLGTMEFRRMDSVLISAFVERWHPETNTFHFPWGEITITLHDVVQILDLTIEGAAVVCQMSDSAIDTAMAEILDVDVRVARSLGRGMILFNSNKALACLCRPYFLLTFFQFYFRCWVRYELDLEGSCTGNVQCP